MKSNGCNYLGFKKVFYYVPLQSTFLDEFKLKNKEISLPELEN